MPNRVLTLLSRWMAGAALPLALAGCVAIGPDYEKPDVPVPDAWRNAPEAAEAGNAGNGAGWWTVFGDPALDALVERVHAENYSLASAVATMEAYAAQLNMERAGLFPSVSASGKTGEDRQSELVHGETEYPENPAWYYNAGLSLSWEIDLWGRVRRSIESARGELEASEEDLRDTQLSLEASAVSEYVTLRTLQRRIAYAEKNLALQEESAKLTRGRFDAGLVSELDVHQAEMNLAYTRSTIPSLQAQVESSLNNLCVLAGALPGELDDLAARAPVPFAADLPDVVPADLLRRRPDVRAAERRFAAKTAAIGVAKGELYPKFAINGQFQLSTTYSDKFFDTGAQSYFIGPAFSWDIFTAGKIRNNVRAKEAAARAALADYRNTVLTAYAECETAFASWRGALRTLDALESAVEAAAKSVELAENLYRNGLTDFQNLLDMQKQLTEYEDSYAQTQGSVASYLVSIHKALGGTVAAPAAAPAEAEAESDPAPEAAPAPEEAPASADTEPPADAEPPVPPVPDAPAAD